MTMRSIATLAVAAFLVTAASAQAASPDEDSAAPAASTQAAPRENGNAGIGTVTAQTSDQWLTSQVIGAAVYNPASEKVGSISDLLLDNKGAPIAAVVNTGGFLGIGGKKVTVDFKSLQFVRTDDGDRVIAPVAKEQLKMAAEFKPYNPPPPVTASRSPISPTPGGPPMNPRSQ